jgi:hypothetical protein
MKWKNAFWIVFPAALVIAFGCVVAWMPVWSPAGLYDAPGYAVLEDGAKAMIVIAKDHTCHVKLYNEDPGHSVWIIDGTWEKDPEDGLFHFFFPTDSSPGGIEEKKGQSYIWGIKIYDSEWDGTPRTFHFRRKLFDFL